MKNLQKRLSVILESKGLDTNARLEKVCMLLDQEKTYYNWVGFYFKNGNKEELKLGPYVGDVTDHVIIPFGKGICGQVAVSGKTLEVPSVKEVDNYLSCSIDTKAELVVPIFKNGENIGQIDIDSHFINPFTQEDHELLEWLGERVSRIL